MKILQMMLKKDLKHQIIKLDTILLTEHCLQERKKKVIGSIKNELGGKIMKQLVARRPKTYSYLMDDGNSDEKAKRTKKKNE